MTTDLLQKLTLLLTACLLAACSSGNPATSDERSGNLPADNPYLGYQSTNYQGTQNWLCHPEKSLDDTCDQNQDTTEVAADGTATEIPFAHATEAEIDCFYLYPTTSLDVGPNSDFIAGTEERQTTQAQFARYSSICRPFAPVYRQIPLTSLVSNVILSNAGGSLPFGDAGEVAWGDVLDSFKEYMANYNNGRPYILVGHSQGSGWLKQLIANEIEQQPYALERLVSAHLFGTTVSVPLGADVGGSFAKVPACRDLSQSGCVVSFSTFRQGDPELDVARFATTSIESGMEAICSNPINLGAGRQAMEVAIPKIPPPAIKAIMKPRGNDGPYTNRVNNLLLLTQFFSVPGQFFAECKTHLTDDSRVNYLEISIESDPDDPRSDDYPGELQVVTGWGLHLTDMSYTHRSLVKLADIQGQAWLAENR